MKRIAIVLLGLAAAGCTAPDIGWYRSSGYRMAGENGGLAPSTVRALPASAIVPDSGGEALHFQRPYLISQGLSSRPAEEHFARTGGLERHIPIESWRGKKMLVSVRLRNAGASRGYVQAQINRVYGPGIRTAAEYYTRNDESWERRDLVLEVPNDATYLFVYSGFTGFGDFWLEGLKLDAAPADAQVSNTMLLPLGPPKPGQATNWYDTNSPTAGYTPPPPPPEPAPPWARN